MRACEEKLMYAMPVHFLKENRYNSFTDLWCNWKRRTHWRYAWKQVWKRVWYERSYPSVATCRNAECFGILIWTGIDLVPLMILKQTAINQSRVLEEFWISKLRSWFLVKKIKIQRETLVGHFVFSKTGAKRKTGVCHLNMQYPNCCTRISPRWAIHWLDAFSLWRS